MSLPVERRQVLVGGRLLSYLAAGAAGPARLVAGEEDTIAPPEEAAAMAAAAHGATLTRTPSAGHVLNLEGPEAFNEVLRALLAACETFTV